MTVASDLTTRHASNRRLMLRIEGLPDELWQDTGEAVPGAAIAASGYDVWSNSTGISVSSELTHRASLDGDTLAVGMAAASSSDGQVKIYRRSGTNTWNLEQTIDPPVAGGGDNFGWSVAVSGDMLIVGEPWNDDVGADAGSFHVYTRSGTTWTYQVSVDGAAAGLKLGYAVDIDSAAGRLVASAVGYDASKGRIYTYTTADAGVTWAIEQTIDSPNPAVGANFGLSVGLLGTQMVAAQGAGSPTQRAYVFEYSGGSWSTALTVSNTSTYSFGVSYSPPQCVAVDTDVAVFSEGKTGASLVHVYRKSGGSWNLEQTITETQAHAWPSIDGNLLAIGERGSHTVRVYIYTNGRWAIRATLVGSNNMGETVSVSGAYISASTFTGGTNDVTVFYGTQSQEAVAGRARAGYACLLPPSEMTSSFDFGEMWPGLSAMTFEIVDIKDSTGKSRFAPVFGAPSRWDSASHWRLSAGANYHVTVAATAGAIPVKTTVGAAAAGNIYIGRERIQYNATNADHFTNCDRGQYAAYSSAWAYTIPRPQEDDGQSIPYVGSVPFSIQGARVCLYVLTYDRTTGRWNSDGSELLLWAGRLDAGVRYIPERGVWQLTARSIVDELEREICTNLESVELDPQGTHVGQLVNLLGNVRTRQFDIHFKWVDSGVTYNARYRYTLAAGVYSYLAKKFPSTSLTKALLVGTNLNHTLGFEQKPDGKLKLKLLINTDNEFACELLSYDTGLGPSHLLNALGWPLWGRWKFDASPYGAGLPNTSVGYLDAPEFEASIYHPLHAGSNGGVLALRLNDGWRFIQNQEASYGGFIEVDEASLVTRASKTYTTNIEKSSGRAFIKYTAKGVAQTVEGHDYESFTLGTMPQPPEDEGANFCVRTSASTKSRRLRQVYVPLYEPVSGQTRGPFELLLHSLLSTGTASYNGAYDKLPVGWGLGIEAGLVDTQSFLDADTVIANSDLAQRRCYPITGPISWKELAQRECKLFGFGIVWERGQIRCKSTHASVADSWLVTLDEGNRYQAHEYPTQDITPDTVINQYQVQLHDWRTDDDLPPITISDADSIMGLAATKAIDIDHPGIDAGWLGADVCADLLKSLLLGRGSALRYPGQIVEVSLNPTLARRVAVLDVVKYTSNLTPNPSGDGTNTTTGVYARVLRVGWDYAAPWKGHAQLMLMTNTTAVGQAWAPAALINTSGTCSGWDEVQRRVYVSPVHFGKSGDDDDGVRFKGGYQVIVVDRCPKDSNNPTTSGPFALASDYDNTSKYISLASGNLSPLNTAKDWVVLFADWGTAPANQRQHGTWQANSVSELFADGNVAQRWGVK